MHHTYDMISGVMGKKIAGQEVAIFFNSKCRFPLEFRQTAANLNFFPNFPKMGVFSSKFCILTPLAMMPLSTITKYNSN